MAMHLESSTVRERRANMGRVIMKAKIFLGLAWVVIGYHAAVSYGLVSPLTWAPAWMERLLPYEWVVLVLCLMSMVFWLLYFLMSSQQDEQWQTFRNDFAAALTCCTLFGWLMFVICA